MGSGVPLGGPEGSGGLPVGPGVVGWPNRMFGMGRESHPEFREGSGVSAGGPGGQPVGPRGAGSPPEGPRGVGRPTLMSGRGRKVHLEVQEAQLEVREGSGGPL